MRQRIPRNDASNVEIGILAPIDQVAGIARILSADREFATGGTARLGAHQGEVDHFPVQIGHLAEGRIGDQLGRPGAAMIGLRVGHALHHHLGQGDDRSLQEEIRGVALTDGEHDAGPGNGPETNGPDRNLIGAADRHGSEEVAPGIGGLDPPGLAGRGIGHLHHRVGNGEAVLPGHGALNHRGRDRLPCEWPEIGYQERQEQRGTLRCGAHQRPSDDSFGRRNSSNGGYPQRALKSGSIWSPKPHRNIG